MPLRFDRTSKSSLAIVGIAVIVAVIVALAVVARDRGPDSSAGRLQIPSDVITEGLGSSNGYATFLIGGACISGGGVATITSVVPIHAEGRAELSDFSVFPFVQLGSNPSSDALRLREMPWFRGAHVVDEPCKSEELTEQQLAVEIHRPGRQDARVDGIRVHYRLGGETRSLDVPYSLVLCSSLDRTCE